MKFYVSHEPHHIGNNRLYNVPLAYSCFILQRMSLNRIFLFFSLKLLSLLSKHHRKQETHGSIQPLWAVWSDQRAMMEVTNLEVKILANWDFPCIRKSIYEAFILTITQVDIKSDSGNRTSPRKNHRAWHQLHKMRKMRKYAAQNEEN